VWVEGSRFVLADQHTTKLEGARIAGYATMSFSAIRDPHLLENIEVGVMLLVYAADQATATAVATIADPLMLHMPSPDMDYLPSLAFATSPAETERGPSYEFVLNHVVDVDDPSSMFRIVMDDRSQA
jgi:hypothetical protein